MAVASGAAKSIQRGWTLSLTGSGHLFVYHLGASQRLLDVPTQSSHPTTNVHHVVGTSGGAIAAAIVASGISIPDYAQAFIEQRGRGLHLLEEFWKNHESSSPRKRNDIGLHIATTRCEDGASKVFSYDNIHKTLNNNDDKQQLLECIRASCLIPPTFHPLDILSSTKSYPDQEGIPLEDPLTGLNFYVDGGIATPAPMVFPDHEEDEGDGSVQHTTRVIVSPIAGTCKETARISPAMSKGWWPHIHVPHDMGIQLSWSNLRALSMATGNVTSTELQNWYQRGQDDAGYFVESLESLCE